MIRGRSFYDLLVKGAINYAIRKQFRTAIHCWGQLSETHKVIKQEWFALCSILMMKKLEKDPALPQETWDKSNIKPKKNLFTPFPPPQQPSKGISLNYIFLLSDHSTCWFCHCCCGVFEVLGIGVKTLEKIYQVVC